MAKAKKKEKQYELFELRADLECFADLYEASDELLEAIHTWWETIDELKGGGRWAAFEGVVEAIQAELNRELTVRLVVETPEKKKAKS